MTPAFASQAMNAMSETREGAEARRIAAGDLAK